MTNLNFSYGLYNAAGLIKFSADLNINMNYYSELKKALNVKRLESAELTRVGLQKDGAYIMADVFYDEGIAYSFGICDDVSWDHAMTDEEYHIYMYDHTINELPYDKFGFHFFREGIAGHKIANEPLDTLENYLKRNGHQDKKNMILKMDVEGAEWDFLETVSTDILCQFDQIVMEMHNLVRADSEEETQRKINLINKLNSTHDLVHLHGNNTGYVIKMGNGRFADVIEVTYVLKDNYQTSTDDNIVLPVPMLDYPNDINRADVNFGEWNKPFVV